MFDKFIFGNKQIPEMYFGNIPVAQIYFGNTLVWEKSSDVPYDDTCTATITLSQDKTSWIVTITKNGEDVTSSLSQMITWIYDGTGERIQPHYAYSDTIDLSQFPRGDYRLDLSRITSKAGGYFPGSGSISAPDHIYIGNLVAGSQNVAIELDLTNETSDLIVNSIEIFTSQTTSATTGRIKILHESGLYVGAIDGNTQDASTERYNLTGRPRSVSNVGVTLYAGKKYYIVFQNSNNSTYYPTYFQNETGNYKVYANASEARNINVADLSVLGNFIGGICTNRHPTSDDKAYILSLNINDSFVYLGYDNTQWDPALYGNHFYRRKSKTYTYSKTIEIADGSAMYKLAKVIAGLKGTNISALQIGDIQSYFYRTGNLVMMATGWTSQIDTDSTTGDPISLSERPSSATKGLYYISNEVQVYDGSNWSRPFQYDIGKPTVETYLNYPDWWNADFEDMNVNYTVDSNFSAITLSTDKKFYLKINGKEV
jgi:hypothetical protein